MEMAPVQTKLYETKKKWFAGKVMGPLMIFVVSSQEQDDEMYAEFLKIVEDLDTTRSMPTHALLYSPTQAPSAKHRAMQKAHVPSQHLMASLKRQALLTDSAIVRGVVTAFTWMLPNSVRVKGFRPDQYKDGFQWLRDDLEFSVDEAIGSLRELVVMVNYPPLGG